MEEAWEDVWQDGLEELVWCNSGLRGVLEQVWEEGLEELVQWNSGLRGVVEEVPEVWQEGCPFDDDDRPSCDGIQGREGCEALVR